MLDFLDLQCYRKELMGNLSYGTQKIVGLARALAGEPRLLLIDELSSGLMREEKENVARFLLRIHYELGIAIIWIEHDMQMVADICDRLICLNFGQKMAEGTAKEVMTDAQVVEAYVGSGVSRAVAQSRNSVESIRMRDGSNKSGSIGDKWCSIQ